MDRPTTSKIDPEIAPRTVPMFELSSSWVSDINFPVHKLEFELTVAYNTICTVIVEIISLMIFLADTISSIFSYVWMHEVLKYVGRFFYFRHSYFSFSFHQRGNHSSWFQGSFQRRLFSASLVGISVNRWSPRHNIWINSDLQRCSGGQF